MELLHIKKNKMKISIISFIVLSIFLSCSNQPDCDNEEEISLAKSLIIQEMKQELSTVLESDGMSDQMKEEMIGWGFTDDRIEAFVDENIELINVRTTEKNEELNKCSCATQISFKISDDFIKNVKKNFKELTISKINKIKTQKLDYEYTLQKIKKDDQLLVEGIVPVKELQSIFQTYSVIQYTIKKINNKEENIK